MLIDSPRLTDPDRAHWARLEMYDAMLATDPHLDRLVDRGVAAIREWATVGAGVVSVSWGKDSVVAAHLAHLAGVDAPLVWVRSDPYEMPECETVRDAYLSTHPGQDYEERVVHLRNPKRGEPGHEAHQLDPASRSQDVLAEAVPERYVSGVRGQESRVRALSVAHRGMVTARTCRPLARWDATHVFAYLHREALPVHPAYAMTYGGALDRQWLRVHPLCSHRDSGHGDTVAWEDRYYGDHIATARRSRLGRDAVRQVGRPSD